MAVETMRLQKYLAQCGVASRRAAEDLITSGHVSVNGEVTRVLGTKVTGEEEICVDGVPVHPEAQKICILLHKPTGYVSTVRDPQGRPTVLSLLSGVTERVYPVGRLDWDSSGLLLLTNDGDLTARITHPRYGISKTYQVLALGIPSGHELNELRRGIVIDGVKTSPAEVECTPKGEHHSVLTFTIHEGRNRQVRRMCEAIGLEVAALTRVAVGGLLLGDLEEGAWRYAGTKDLEAMFAKPKAAAALTLRGI